MASAIDSLMEVLGGVGTVLDTPRAMAWAGATGRDPLSAAVNPEERLTGWDLMKSLGFENREGFDPVDVGAVASEAVLDPLNLLAGLGIAKRLLALTKAKKANTATLAAAQKANLAADRYTRYLADAERKFGVEQMHLAKGLRKLGELPPDKVIDPLKRARKYAAKYGGSPEMAMDLLHGSPDEAAQAVADAYGLRRVRRMTSPDVKAMSEGVGAVPFGFEPGSSRSVFTTAFVPEHRPDIVMLNRDYATGANLPNIMLHEGIHSVEGQFPAEDRILRNAIGHESAKGAGGRYFQAPPLFEQAVQHDPKLAWDEAYTRAAEEIYRGNPEAGQAILRWANRRGEGEELREILARNAKDKVQHLDEPTVVNYLADLIQGKVKQRHALVPAGPLEDLTLPPIPDIGPAVPAAQYVEPMMQALPRVRPSYPRMAGYGLYEGARAGHQDYQPTAIDEILEALANG